MSYKEKKKENYLGLKPVRGRQSARQKQLKQADQPSLLDDPGSEGTGA